MADITNGGALSSYNAFSTGSPAFNNTAVTVYPGLCYDYKRNLLIFTDGSGSVFSVTPSATLSAWPFANAATWIGYRGTSDVPPSPTAQVSFMRITYLGNADGSGYDAFLVGAHGEIYLGVPRSSTQL
jgi:hypothetical protein